MNVIRVHEYTKSAKWAYNMYNLIRGQNRKKNCHKGEVSNTTTVCFIFWYVQNYRHKKREETAG